jgi:hypothetical protein
MAEKAEKPAAAPAAASVPKVDEFADGVFKALGFKDPLPEGLVWRYQQVKRVRDSIQPGRLSPEAFGIIVMLHETDKTRE